jgi:hypothetical protein
MTDISGLILTQVDKTVFGNKRVHTFKGYVGNGTDTIPSAGIQAPAKVFGLASIEFMEISGGSLNYSYDYNSSCVMAWAADSGINYIVSNPVVPTSGIEVRFRATGVGLG